jgi:cyclopropane fatty-acyl-phospholipid synthase-like methyltransferase
MNGKPTAPAAERNKKAILGVLRYEFSDLSAILEIGSGTGQHAVYFAEHLPHLSWQTSDVVDNHAAIRAWVDDADLPNLVAPLDLDVLNAAPVIGFDGVFSANTAHIMSIAAVDKMFSLVSMSLPEGGVFALYGPFRQDGKFNTASNAEFHRSLRRANPEMGIRHLEELDAIAQAGHMRRRHLYAMPASNHIAVWIKDDAVSPLSD